MNKFKDIDKKVWKPNNHRYQRLADILPQLVN